MQSNGFRPVLALAMFLGAISVLAQTLPGASALLNQAATAMGVGATSITGLEAAETYTVFRNNQ